MAKILVIDDTAQIRKFLRISLSANGHTVLEAETGQAGLALCTSERPDLVILDLGLPDGDGQEIITAVRATGPVPILVLSVRAQEYDKVEALDRGADDYVVKPFGIGELMARVRVALRPRAGENETLSPLIAGPLRIDLERRVVEKEGVPVHLSRKEYELLAILARHADHVLTHTEILRAVWGPAHIHDTAYLRVYVKQLRQKLEPDPNAPRLIMTEAGVGYRFRLPGAEVG